MVVDPKKGTVYLDPGDGTGLQSASFFPPEGHKTVVWSSPNIGVDNGYDRWFSGSIDEVAVYDWALSPAEIANLDLLRGVCWAELGQWARLQAIVARADAWPQTAHEPSRTRSPFSILP